MAHGDGQHHTVTENTPGYLPDSEPATFGTLAEAHEYAAELATELLDDGYTVEGGHGDYWAEDPRKIHDLGRRIETYSAYDNNGMHPGHDHDDSPFAS